jgi:hypothetical protein
MDHLRQQYHFREIDNKVHIWDVNKLIKATDLKKSQKVSLSHFEDEYYSDYWSKSKTLTCYDISIHSKLINEANLSFPVIVCPDMKMIDGMHRVCKAFLSGQKFIDAIVLDRLPSPDFIDVDPKDLVY